ncbi:hypothetical protein NRI_0044 [Neorickettsia risticii str. Illinois]|uniref:Uncharacterized protein n=1 Tax=Neorickettsia risticii (strain Illinois) TaxID=434131 RepID=C6V3S6_NEORI|nr:hypothetical protein NRI_0044 [Neorickettsia risticii str. Illinois]
MLEAWFLREVVIFNDFLGEFCIFDSSVCEVKIGSHGLRVSVDS